MKVVETPKKKKTPRIKNPARLLDPSVSALLSAFKELQATAKRPPALLSVKDSAAYLGGVKKDFIYDLVNSSEIRVIQRVENGKILIPVRELDRWIEKRLAYMH